VGGYLYTEFLIDVLQTPPIVAGNRTVVPLAKSQVIHSYAAGYCVLSMSYSVLSNSVGVHLHVGSKSQLLIIKPAQKRRQNSKTIQIHKTEY
jgi:hypothetical protein